MTNQMKKYTRPLLVLPGLVLAAVALLVGWRGARLFRGLPKEVATPLVTGMLTIVVAVFTVIGGFYLTRRKDREQRVRESRIPVYEDFVRTFFEGFSPNRQAQPTPEAMRTLAQRLVVWGSDDIIGQWSRYRRSVASGAIAPGSRELLFEFEDLLFAVRDGLGHADRKLTRGDLLGMFVTDIDRYL